MRRNIYVTALLFFAMSASAQELSDPVVFLPSADDEGGKVLFSSGEEAPVVAGQGDEKPDDCPDNGFWVKVETLLSCLEGVEYRFVPPPGDFLAFSTAIGLERVKGPPFGTDDGGPFVDGKDE